ncbi:MAG: hypothetical protein CFE43_09280 [Burkholderiales bacterium PBB3]|nr:MAG: hypothetical protein CFE43_09280 [Burkholderiales bacterium PBB3]
MIVSLNDPASILNWWKVFPERHDAFLEFKLRASPEFAPAIREAQRRIAASPELRELHLSAARAGRIRSAEEDPEDICRSPYELRRAEVA